ncbi:hypothetical protein L1987_18905 [Smallanthus sonchifolius]|uniref:Uncharacterized protein n=1 Tax=Smallanthus sonchifolius TaxID=185202 RepID=A0ACB9J383_9ASTR|nr:hypothetical protein L1987_18905 [Smallanthus sonchifolius]
MISYFNVLSFIVLKRIVSYGHCCIEQQLEAAMYSASHVDMETVVCFLHCHETSRLPRNWQHHVVDFLYRNIPLLLLEIWNRDTWQTLFLALMRLSMLEYFMSTSNASLSNMTNILNYDNVIDTPTKPPRLMNLKDYSNWKIRSENYVNINDMSMWIPVAEGYKHPTHSHMSVSDAEKPVSALTVEKKTLYDREKKALAALSMCLPLEIYHTFKKFKTSRDLWEGLAKRCEGSTYIKKSIRELLKKQFSVFKSIEGESINELMSRYYHLLSEMVNNDISYKNRKEKFLKAKVQKKVHVVNHHAMLLLVLDVQRIITMILIHETGLGTSEENRKEVHWSDNQDKDGNNQNNQSSSTALISQHDENYDCGIHLEDIVAHVSQAFLAEVHTDAGSDNSSSDSDSSDSWNVNEVISVRCPKCVDSDLKIPRLCDDNTNLIIDLKASYLTNQTLKDNEKLLNERIESLKDDIKVLQSKSEVTKLRRKLECYKNSSFPLEYYTEKSSSEKVVGGVGYCSNDDEFFDSKRVQGQVKDYKVVELVIIKRVTRDRCILTEPDEDIEQTKPKSLKPFVSAGFDFQEINKIEKISTVEFIKEKVEANKPKVVKLFNIVSQCESSGSGSVQKEMYARVYKEKHACFHCRIVGQILINYPDKNVGKRLDDPRMGSSFVESKTKSVMKYAEVKPVVKVSEVQGTPRRTVGNHWYVDSGCSCHMTGNLNLLENVKEIQGGYVAFVGKKGGNISGQGSVSNGRSSFEKVNYVEQLEHNMLSVSQVCDKDFSLHFNQSEWLVLKPGFDIPEDWILMRAPRKNDTYMLDMRTAMTTSSIPTCLLSKASESESTLWHRKMAHINFRKMNFLVKNGLVSSVPAMRFHVNEDCIPCKKGKQHRKSHNSKLINSFVTPLELLHMDLFGPISVKSEGGKSYCLVVTDDYSRFSSVKFLISKDETVEILNFLILGLESLFKKKVRRISSYNGTEFKNENIGLFCLQKDVHHEFISPYVPQQNGVAEQKN